MGRIWGWGWGLGGLGGYVLFDGGLQGGLPPYGKRGVQLDYLTYLVIIYTKIKKI